MRSRFTIEEEGKPPVECHVEGDMTAPPLLGIIPRFWRVEHRGLTTDVRVFTRAIAERRPLFGADCGVLAVHYRGLRELQMMSVLPVRLKAY